MSDQLVPNVPVSPLEAEALPDFSKERQKYADLLMLPAYSPVATASSEIRAAFTDVTLHEAIDAAQFSCSYPICGYLSLTPEKKLHICRRRAGLNTKHEAVGRCFLHDPEGAFIEAASPYARHLSNVPSVQELFEDIQSSRKEFTFLNQELSMARTVLAAQLKRLNPNYRHTARNQDIMSNVMQCLESIRKLAESAAKIQTLGSQQLTLDGVSAFLWTVQRIIEEEILDANTRIRIFDRISTEAKFPTT